MTKRPYSPPTLRRLTVRQCSTKGRFRVYLGKGHPWATASGQQWRYRLVAMLLLGRRLRVDEHVDHRDENRTNDAPENLRVLLVEGRYANHRSPLRVLGVVAEPIEGEGFYEYAEPMEVETPF